MKNEVLESPTEDSTLPVTSDRLDTSALEILDWVKAWNVTLESILVGWGVPME